MIRFFTLPFNAKANKSCSSTYHKASIRVCIPHNSRVIAPTAAHSDSLLGSCSCECSSPFPASLALLIDSSESEVVPIRARVVCSSTVSVTICFFDALGSACLRFFLRSTGSVDPGAGCHKARTVPVRVITTDSRIASIGQRCSATSSMERISELISFSVAGIGSCR